MKFCPFIALFDPISFYSLSLFRPFIAWPGQGRFTRYHLTLWHLALGRLTLCRWIHRVGLICYCKFAFPRVFDPFIRFNMVPPPLNLWFIITAGFIINKMWKCAKIIGMCWILVYLQKYPFLSTLIYTSKHTKIVLTLKILHPFANHQKAVIFLATRFGK